MRAAVVRRYGPPEVIALEDVPDPEPQSAQAIVEVRAAAVNFPDALVVRNAYQVPVPLPFVPGSEFAGVVRSVGAEVDGLHPGDHVVGGGFTGAFAEAIAVPVAGLVRVPAGTDLRAAAAFWVTYSTAFHALRSIAEVSAGDWVAVLGAAGGVGLAAVDVAQYLGGRVLAAASTDEKLATCRARGAAATVNYTAEDLKARLRELTDGGADVVLDPVGGAYAEQALRSTRWGGRFVVVGFASGQIPRIPLNLVLLKGPIVRGFELRTFAEHAPDDFARDRAELAALFETGRLRPHVSAVFSLDETAGAMRHVVDRKAHGKVVIEP